jgi:subtilisin family serine protease
MKPLDVVNLTPLMERVSGKPQIRIGLIDGPVALTHPELARDAPREVLGRSRRSCAQVDSTACLHGTFIAGILSAKRGSGAPAICPSCTLLIRPIFSEVNVDNRQLPGATPADLAAAIGECVEAGAHVINLSLALTPLSMKGERELEQVIEHAARRGVVIVAAAGNQGTLGSSSLTRHPWVISVAACDLQGRLASQSNLGSSLGKQGLRAPDEQVTSLGAGRDLLTLSGSSVATPFVTGTIALLRSEFPAASATEVKFAVTRAPTPRRTTVIPPLLDAWRAYQYMRTMSLRR